jgi:hypothetical protein
LVNHFLKSLRVALPFPEISIGMVAGSLQSRHRVH